MPIPFLLAGAAVFAGVLGAGGHLSASETNEKAQLRAKRAELLYNTQKNELEQEQSRTEQLLLKLGYEKKNVLNSSMREFVKVFDKIKHIKVTESIGLDEIEKFAIDQQGVLEIRKMSDIYSTTLESGATGAAAGAIIALAASGSLSVVTSGLATAGSVLMLGDIGMAAGIAGSALSFGAAMTPLAAVAAPVILFTGISASMKADENLEKADAMYAQAEAAVEKMKNSEIICKAIGDKADMFYDLLMKLDELFSECVIHLVEVVQKKENESDFKEKLTDDEIKLIAVTRSLAGAVKAVIDTPMLSKNGSVSDEAKQMYAKTKKALPDFERDVVKVNATRINFF